MEKKQIPIVAFAISAIMLMTTIIIPFDNAYADETVFYNVVGDTTATISCSGAPSTARIFTGLETTATSSLVGKTINRVVIPLEWDGGITQSGTITIGVWNSTTTPTASNRLFLFGTKAGSAITTDMVNYNFTNMAGYKFKGQEALGVFFDSNDDTKCIRTMVKASDVFDTTLTRVSHFDEPSTWTDVTTNDAGFKLVSFIGNEDVRFCIDTTGDSEPDVCFTDTNGDGVPDAGAGGALAVYRGTANATKFGTDLGCGFGITSCTNTDIKTNGVGLFYLLIIIIWSYAMLVFIHFEAKKISSSGNVHLTEVLNINPLLLVVMLVIDVGITFYLGWIPDLIFYSTIVVVIGLSAFGLYRHFKG